MPSSASSGKSLLVSFDICKFCGAYWWKAEWPLTGGGSGKQTFVHRGGQGRLTPVGGGLRPGRFRAPSRSKPTIVHAGADSPADVRRRPTCAVPMRGLECPLTLEAVGRGGQSCRSARDRRQAIAGADMIAAVMCQQFAVLVLSMPRAPRSQKPASRARKSRASCFQLTVGWLAGALSARSNACTCGLIRRGISRCARPWPCAARSARGRGATRGMLASAA